MSKTILYVLYRKGQTNRLEEGAHQGNFTEIPNVEMQ